MSDLRQLRNQQVLDQEMLRHAFTAGVVTAHIILAEMAEEPLSNDDLLQVRDAGDLLFEKWIEKGGDALGLTEEDLTVVREAVQEAAADQG